MKELGNDVLYEKKHAKYLLFSWLVLLLGLSLSCLTGYYTKTNMELYNRRQFETRCKEIRVQIQAQLAKHRQMLLSGAAMFDASNDVNREEWRIYVKRLRLNRDLDGVQALGFSLWIKPNQLKSHEAGVRKEGFADYHVKPEGKREAYTSIIYIEPFEGRNLRAFGYDMYSESIRHAAMNQAIDNNNVRLSSKVILLQENATDVQAGTLMYAPIYQKNKPFDTVEQRRAAIFGWVYSPFRMTDLLGNIILSYDEINVLNLRLSVYDGNLVQAENLLYQSQSRISGASPLFSLETQIELYGALWTLHFEQFENAEKSVDYSKSWIITSAGLFISFLLFFLLRAYFLMQKNAYRIALALTQQLHEKEKKLALVNADLMQFTNIAAHHLQEPTRRIISFIQRLQNELANIIPSTGEVTFSLNFIQQSAYRQRALVRDIQRYLAVTQPHSVVESVDVMSVIRKVLDYNAPLISKTNARVEYGDLLTVTIDCPRLYDIFNVLLNNSLCYSRPNCPPKIRIYAEPKGNRICYYVEDNGMGIPAEYRERVFLVFERLQVTDNQDSTGIGLAIVRRIVESCDGAVMLKETIGGGTTVVFDLPAGI